MEQPQGFYAKRTRRQGFIASRKALYGLKQASLAWNKAANKSLIEIGFKRRGLYTPPPIPCGIQVDSAYSEEVPQNLHGIQPFAIWLRSLPKSYLESRSFQVNSMRNAWNIGGIMWNALGTYLESMESMLSPCLSPPVIPHGMH